MEKLATATVAIALLGTSAFAADMGAPPPAPAPVYNWTGWYVGVNAGASFGNVKTDFNAPVNVAVTTPPPPATITATGNFGFAGSDRTYPSGFTGGGQIGYNWQFSPIWVVGLEADFQGALERDSSTLTNNFSGNATGCVPTGGGSVTCLIAPVSGSSALDYQTKIDWFGTVRLRAGYVWGNGEVMSYVTGGLAYGKVEIEGITAASGFAAGPPFSITPQAFGHSQVNTGWVVGYGTEGVINFWGARNWTWKIEGLYMDLGHLDATGPVGSFNTTFGTETIAVNGQVTTHSHFTDGILRAGLNYKFY